MKKLIILLAIVSGCANSSGGGGGGTPAAVSGESCGSKDLLSTWRKGSEQFDLSGDIIGDNRDHFVTSDGFICYYHFTIEGTQCSGTFLTDRWTSVTSTNECQVGVMPRNMTYTKSELGLEVCSSGGVCTTYN
jgi:hypothetical protein